jgi:hypothetical protein
MDSLYNIEIKLRLQLYEQEITDLPKDNVDVKLLMLLTIYGTTM